MTTQSVSQPAVAAAPPAVREGRGWAVAGIVGALVALVVVFGLSVQLTNDHSELWKDNHQLIPAIADNKHFVWLFQASTSLSALLVMLFGAGLRRRLERAEPAGSLIPGLAFAGILLVAALLLVGGGMSTELYWGLAKHDEADPDTVAASLGIYNTMAWVWAGAGLSAGAVAVAGFRRRTVGRGLAAFSALMAALLALVQLTPVQYMALLPGALWVLGTGAAFALSKHR
ncbi:hypothetical protein [uncultured Thermomonospora sp.]|uniref:hypothetical protein n=1 Tax=uncultured Thermomonospora sp. TaxID=671175 RepID=UPI00259B3D68|nr:hypothetical protein [uncultured Thermomonospora sp.]